MMVLKWRRMHYGPQTHKYLEKMRATMGEIFRGAGE
jgi:hypothetical protein